MASRAAAVRLDGQCRWCQASGSQQWRGTCADEGWRLYDPGPWTGRDRSEWDRIGEAARGVTMTYHGKVIGRSGQIYLCEHNHRTMTAAITCANSSGTRRMAAMAWNRAAVQAAQAAALARKRDEERAAAEARKIAAREASAARRAAAQAAAEEAKAAKRAARLAAMSPQRAWKRMTPAERLLRTAQAELEVYGEIISADAKAAYNTRAAKPAAPNSPVRSGTAPPGSAVPPRARTAGDVPAFVRALDPGLSPDERTLAKGEAARDPEQWQKYLAALRAQHEAQADREIARLKARMSGETGVPARGRVADGGRPPSAAAPSESAPPRTAITPWTRPAATGPVPNGSGPRAAEGAPSGLSGTAADAAADVRRRGNTAGGKPAAGFGGDGLFVVGLDITPGVYRTAGPVSGRDGYFALLRSTNTHDIVNNSIVRGPATITVGPGVKAVEVRRCQPWQWLGDNLDAVIAAASEPGNTAGRD